MYDAYYLDEKNKKVLFDDCSSCSFRYMLDDTDWGWSLEERMRLATAGDRYQIMFLVARDQIMDLEG